MSHTRVYAFIAGVWALMILGGGIAVLVLGPIHIDGADDITRLAVSVAKMLVAVLLVAAWVYILAKVKTRLFSRYAQ